MGNTQGDCSNRFPRASASPFCKKYRIPQAEKRIQVTYSGPAQPIIGILGVDAESDVRTEGPVGGGVPGEIQPINDLAEYYFYEDYKLLPNSDYEFVALLLPSAGILHQVVIDSISVPEPTTGTLMGMIFALFVVAQSRRSSSGGVLPAHRADG